MNDCFTINFLKNLLSRGRLLNRTFVTVRETSEQLGTRTEPGLHQVSTKTESGLTQDSVFCIEQREVDKT